MKNTLQCNNSGDNYTASANRSTCSCSS